MVRCWTHTKPLDQPMPSSSVHILVPCWPQIGPMTSQLHSWGWQVSVTALYSQTKWRPGSGIWHKAEVIIGSGIVLVPIRHQMITWTVADFSSNESLWKLHHTNFNPLRAKFFRGNINIYLYFVSFLHTNKTQVVEIPPRVRQGPA